MEIGIRARGMRGRRRWRGRVGRMDVLLRTREPGGEGEEGSGADHQPDRVAQPDTVLGAQVE